MSSILSFLQSQQLLALLMSLLIFFTTLLLVAKRWIGFSITLLLLVFALAAGLIINHQQQLQDYLNFSPHRSTEKTSPEDFHQHMMQAMEDLKLEVTIEKDNLRRVMNQVQEIFNSMDMQKQKLQNFIDEATEKFKTDYPTHFSSHPSESLKHPSQKKESVSSEI